MSDYCSERGRYIYQHFILSSSGFSLKSTSWYHKSRPLSSLFSLLHCNIDCPQAFVPGYTPNQDYQSLILPSPPVGNHLFYIFARALHEVLTLKLCHITIEIESMICLFQPLFILLSGLLSTVKGEKTNYMINPVYINGKSPVWTIGDQKVVAWKTDLPVFNVSIWQQSPLGGGAYTRGNVYGMPNEEPTTRNRTDKSQPKLTKRTMYRTSPGLSNSTASIWIIHPHFSSGSTPDQAVSPRPIST